MKPTVRKRIAQYTVILSILASTAWFGWYFAHKKAAEILEPYVLDLIAEGDYEGLELLVKWRPEVISRVTFPQKYAFIHINPTWLRDAPRPIDISLLVAQDYPLIYAAVVKKPIAVRILLEHGADPNVRDAGDETAIFHATRNGDVETIRLLAAHGADPNVTARDHLPPIFFAHEDDVALALVDAETDLKFSFQGLTVLHVAATQNNPKLLERVLDAGVSVNCINSSKTTPLHRAAAFNSVECIKLLLANGANKNAQDKYGDSPLLTAVQCGNIDVAGILLKAGANHELRNSKGYNAFHQLVEWASSIEDDDFDSLRDDDAKRMIRLLHKAKIDPQAPDKFGRTPLEAADGYRVKDLLIECIPSLKPSKKTNNE